MQEQFISSISHSPFLCENESLRLFCQDYQKNYSLFSNKKWSVLCERREDIVSIRNQIFHELENPEQIHGISIYTPDTLAEKICASLCNLISSQENNSWTVPESLLKPYLDMSEQESLVETLLILFGYTASDSLAVAKQILTLIDAPLPKETNYFELFLATQDSEKNKKKQSISEISLKQILATLQLSKLELSEYARFQVLVDDYLKPQFERELRIQLEQFQLKKNSPFQVILDILTSPFLWISAPEYNDSYSYLTTKPGNFQSHHIRDFQSILKNMRNIANPPSLFPSLFYEARFILNSKEKEQNQANISLSENHHLLFKQAEQIYTKSDKAEYLVLADFNPSDFASIHTQGNGSYAITKKDLESWQSNKFHHDPFYKTVHEQISAYFESFIEKISLFNKHQERFIIANTYSLKTPYLDEKSILDLFFIETLKNSILLGPAPVLNACPKTLSLFPSKMIPDKIIFLGRPHSPVAQSFNVKILNQIFHHLKQNGVEIEIPATEGMYQSYWKNLMSLSCNKEFWITNISDLEKFPNYIDISNISLLNNITDLNYQFRLYNQQNEIYKCWKENFSLPVIGITQFEDYVNCPKKFKYKHCLNLSKNEQDQKINSKQIGIIMHKVAEQFVSRFVIFFGNEGYVVQMPSILETAIEALSCENIFLSMEKVVWKNRLKEFLSKKLFSVTLTVILETFYECIDCIWEQETEFLEQLQQREILKRSFFRFLLTEFENLKLEGKKKVGLFREFPIKFSFHGLNLVGRIDRIDLGNNGLQIIDYKTSNLPKNQTNLTLFPSSKIKNKLSVQGALYSYGFLKQLKGLSEPEDEDAAYYQLEEYSLFYLKNLNQSQNNCLTYYFSEPCRKNDHVFQEIEENYADYANRLQQGDFSCKPIQGDITCMFCDYKSICPKTYHSQSKPLLAEEG